MDHDQDAEFRTPKNPHRYQLGERDGKRGFFCARFGCGQQMNTGSAVCAFFDGDAHQVPLETAVLTAPERAVRR